MGVFGTYTGDKRIAEEKKKVFSEHMIKLLNYGGMMRFDKVNMYGKEVPLLVPIDENTKGEIEFHYNYFEDDAWESAYFNTDTCVLWTGKIGSNEFDDVMMACYMLYEAYSEENGFAELNGEVVDSTEYMGWINNVLGTSFSMKRRFNLWENMEYVIYDMEYSNDKKDIMRYISYIIPSGMHYCAFGLDYVDLLYISQGTDSIDEQKDTLQDGTYPADIYKAKCLIKDYLQNDYTNKMDKLISMLKQDRSNREKEKDIELMEIAKLSLYMPARVLLYLAAEQNENINFWDLWKDIKESVYHDEILKEYVPEEIEELRKAVREKSIEPVKTSTFLIQNGSFDFWGTPEEIKDNPNYYLSDDDRLYWWDGTDEVVISEKTDKWLLDLSKQHKEIVDKDAMTEITDDILKYFLAVLSNVNEYYKRIYPFQSMFYEFIQNGKNKEYLAAIKLFENLADMESYKKDGEIIRYASFSWDLTSRNVTHNSARIKLKRYLSVMANVKLRKKYFGF